MHYFKLIAITTLFITSNVYSQQTENDKKAQETVKQSEAAKRRLQQQIGDVTNLIPITNDSQEQGHSPESFFDKQARQYKEIKEQLNSKGLLDGVNADGTAQHIPIEIEQNFMHDQEQQLKTMTQRFNESGLLEGFDAKSIEERTEKYRDAAQLLADQSNDGMLAALQEELGINFSPSQDPDFDPNSVVEPNDMSAIFISFNMPPNSLKKVMAYAAKQGIPLYLKGMHPDDAGINDTMRRLRFLGIDMEQWPDVRFKPRYFEQYNIHSAPTVFIRSKEGATYASGITNLSWLSNKFNRDGPQGYIGTYGDSVSVIERDIKEVLQARFASIDHEGKRDQVINTFWKKQQFNALPPATEDDVWYIDPTVKAKKDIINPRGDQLAKQGQILNPLEQFPVPLTMYIFDATDNRQLEWVAANHRKGEGQTMLIFSALNKDKGWDHLSALRNYFGRELYQLPPELINRFDLKALPVVISTDMKRKLMKVSQYSTSRVPASEEVK